VESAGCLILQGADERVLDPWCTVMFHLGTDSHPENHPIIIEKWCEHNKRFRAKVNEMLFQKIKEKKPNLTPKKFSEMNFFDTIFMPEQAIEWNLADRVMVEGELAQA
jgi:ATP-dependent protease ClpP protease subunit